MGHGDLPPEGRKGRDAGFKREVVRLPSDGVDLQGRLGPLPANAPSGRPLPSQRHLPLDAPEEERVDLSNPEVVWEQDRDSRAPTPVGWIVLVGVVIAITGLWALSKVVRGDRTISEQSKAAEALLEVERKQTEAAEQLLAQAETVLGAYLAAETIEEKVKFVRHPERVRPLMEEYYREHALEPKSFRNIDQLWPVTIEKFPFVYLRVNLTEGRNVPFVLEQTSAFGLKFDWESEVVLQPMPVETYLKEQPTTPMDFRAYVAKDSHYAHEFADQERYQSLFLSFKGTDEFLFAYVERDSPAGWRLMKYLEENAGRAVPAFLRLRFLEGAAARRSVEVVDLVAPRWAYLHSPEAE